MSQGGEALPVPQYPKSPAGSACTLTHPLSPTHETGTKDWTLALEPGTHRGAGLGSSHTGPTQDRSGCHTQGELSLGHLTPETRTPQGLWSRGAWLHPQCPEHKVLRSQLKTW